MFRFLLVCAEFTCRIRKLIQNKPNQSQLLFDLPQMNESNVTLHYNLEPIALASQRPVIGSRSLNML